MLLQPCCFRTSYLEASSCSISPLNQKKQSAMAHTIYYCSLSLFMDGNRMLLKSATEFPHHHHPNLIRSGPESCGCNCFFWTCTSKFDHPCLTKSGINFVWIVDLDFLNVQLVASCCIILHVSSLVKTRSTPRQSCYAYKYTGRDAKGHIATWICSLAPCRGDKTLWFWDIVKYLWTIWMNITLYSIIIFKCIYI